MSDPTLLNRLVQRFYPNPELLGFFEFKKEAELPEPYRQLLAHHEHMTVTVEAFHGCSVNVEVLQSFWDPPIYCRKILLKRSCDHRNVQFGLVRLDTSVLSNEVRDQIIEGLIPLGRILIEHNVLRKVTLESLWRVECGDELTSYFENGSIEFQGHLQPQRNCDPNGRSITYGRTARIHFGDVPALELLEIVSPA